MKAIGTTVALGKAVVLYGEAIDNLDLASRITLALLATGAGTIASFLLPSKHVEDSLSDRIRQEIKQPYADVNALYEKDLTIDISELNSQVSPPPDPNCTMPVYQIDDVDVHLVFVGSCINEKLRRF